MSVNNLAVGDSVLNNYRMDQGRFAKGDELGKNEFLQLLVAQLNNQDPLAPQENGEFIAQLAQFSTVEGIENMNGSMQSMLEGFQSSQALQASSLVGRTVTLPANKALVDTTEGLSGKVAVPQASNNVLINVYAADGSLASRINMGPMSGGLSDFRWDGTDGAGNQLPAGVYSFEAISSVGGENTQLTTVLPANVDSVSLGGGKGGELTLNLAGIGSVGLSGIYSISQ